MRKGGGAFVADVGEIAVPGGVGEGEKGLRLVEKPVYLPLRRLHAQAGLGGVGHVETGDGPLQLPVGGLFHFFKGQIVHFTRPVKVSGGSKAQAHVVVQAAQEGGIRVSAPVAGEGLFKQGQGPIHLAEGVKGGGRVYVGRTGGDGALHAQLVHQAQGLPCALFGLVPFAGLSVVARHLAPDEQLAPLVIPLPGFLQPVEKVPLHRGVVQAAHVFVQLVHNPPLGDRPDHIIALPRFSQSIVPETAARFKRILKGLT